MKKFFSGFFLGVVLCYLVFALSKPEPISIHPSVSKVPNAYGAQYGQAQVWFASEDDMKVFQSFDQYRQQAIIISNKNTIIHFSKEKATNAP